MISILIIALQTFRQIIHIKPNENDYYMPHSFGFQQGGSFTIKVTNSTNRDLVAVIATADNIEELKQKGRMNILCSSITHFDFIHTIHIRDGYGIISGNIMSKGMYKTMFKSCDFNNKECLIELIFMNPNSCLSYEIQPCLITIPIITVISFPFLAKWCIDMYHIFSYHILLKYLLMLSFLSFYLERFFLILEFQWKDKNDCFSNLFIYRHFLMVLKNSFLVSSLHLIFIQLGNIFKKNEILLVFLSFVLCITSSFHYLTPNIIDGIHDGKTLLRIALIFWFFALTIGLIDLQNGIESQKRKMFAWKLYIYFFILYIITISFFIEFRTFVPYYWRLIVDIITMAILSFMSSQFKIIK